MRPRALIPAVAAVAALAGAAVAQAAWKSAAATTTATFAAAAEFPPVVRAVPSVLGTAQMGVALHATTGAFAPAATSATTTWLRCDATGAGCAATGATGAGYTPGLADVGKTLRAELTPVNGATPGAAVRSEPTAAVLALNLGPVLKVPVAANAPAISGTATVGQTLTGGSGLWLQGLISFSYTWRRCDAIGAGCAPIPGATSQSYTPTAADRGLRLALAVTASVAGLTASTTVTATTATVA